MELDYAPAGASPSVGQLRQDAERVARTEATVLIQGESGTGKERLARFVHHKSRRAAGPFVVCDCSALPPTLIESELFGHAKGAYTGADRARTGLLREAHGGTILFDEIGELEQPMQSKLLRVLQEREVRPIGVDAPVPVDVRVLAATHRDLRAMVKSGGFRQDLYYRLAVFPLAIAPLRERLEDLPELVAVVLTRAAPWLAAPPRLTASALDKLAAHPWPGNVRELLENVLTRAVIYGEGTVIEADMIRFSQDGEAAADRASLLVRQSLGKATLPELLARATRDIEVEAIRGALERCRGSATGAAKLLGISRGALYTKLTRYGLDRVAVPEA